MAAVASGVADHTIDGTWAEITVNGLFTTLYAMVTGRIVLLTAGVPVVTNSDFSEVLSYVTVPTGAVGETVLWYLVGFGLSPINPADIPHNTIGDESVEKA